MNPQTEAELADMVASASQPLRIVGGGTRQALGCPVAGMALNTGELAGIVDYQPGALTLVARAGTRLSEIDAALAGSNQHLAFEPMDHRLLLGSSGEPTIGGVVAGNLSGPRRVQAGACRDFLLGLRFVDGLGNAVKTGGRVMKNVTGLDLVKLLAGSFGSVGIITEVAFKVLPKPEASAQLTLDGLSDENAISAMAMVLGSPFEITGAAHIPGRAMTYIRLEGFEASVKYRIDRVRDLLAAFGPAEIITDARAIAENWRSIRDVADFAAVPGAVWRISTRPSVAPLLVASIGKVVTDARAIYDCGGGLVWLLVPDTLDASAGLIRSNLREFGGGHATLIRAGEATRGSVPVFEPEPVELRRISRGIRAKFDPKGILNRGIFGADSGSGDTALAI